MIVELSGWKLHIAHFQLNTHLQCFAGGLVGGITGSIIGFMQADQYDGAVQQLLQLEGARREQLMQAVGGVLKAAGASAIQFESPEAFRGALVELATRRQVRDQLWQACLRAMED